MSIFSQRRGYSSKKREEKSSVKEKMNFVTPRQRQQWLDQAEDYADMVK